jgi:hypothetical protein
MRQYAGFGDAAESNRRYKLLLAKGTTGLSSPSICRRRSAYDSDHPIAEGEVGKVGVAIDSLADMLRLFDGIPLDRGVDVDDDQRDGADLAGAVRRRSRRSRACRARSCAARCRTTSSRSTWRAAPTSSRRRPRCGSSPT